MRGVFVWYLRSSLSIFEFVGGGGASPCEKLAKARETTLWISNSLCHVSTGKWPNNS